MKKIVIIGGAGFIGINTAIHYAKKGKKIIIFDNFSRYGSKKNIKFVTSKFPNQIEIVEGGGSVDQETRLYDPDKGETRSMRSKERLVNWTVQSTT